MIADPANCRGYSRAIALSGWQHGCTGERRQHERTKEGDSDYTVW